MTTTTELVEHRTIGVRVGAQRRDIVAPLSMSLADALAWAGITVIPSLRLLRERSGEVLDPQLPIETLVDGDIVSLVDPRVDELSRTQRHKRASLIDRAPSAAAWWFMGVAGVILCVAFILFPATRPTGWALPIAAVIALAAVAAGIVAVRSADTKAVKSGTRVLGPAAIVAATAVLLTPAGEFSWTVTVMTVMAAVAVFFAATAVVALNRSVRAQLISYAWVSGALFLIHATVLVLGLREVIAAAITVGAVPLVLRALPTTLLHVPAGMFIDFSRHQQSRFAVREEIPEFVTTIDPDRVTGLVEAATARMSVVTASVCALLIINWPAMVANLWHATTTAFIATLVAAAMLCLGLALMARRFSSRPLKWTLRATSVIIATMTLVVFEAGATAVAGKAIAIGAFVVGILIAMGVVLYARGARSVFWSRAGDIVESMAVAFSLPAALVAAGIIDTIRGAVS